MAKGKHAPAKGAINKNKVVHPCSRKAARLNTKEQRKMKISSTQKVGGVRLQLLGEKLLWFHDNLEAYLDSAEDYLTKEAFLELVEGYLARFTDELEQIEIKTSVGFVKNRRLQHASRKDVIDLTMKTEREEFEGCGLELPDLLEVSNLEYFRDWNGELRFVQNIKVRRFKKKDLSNSQSDNDNTIDDESSNTNADASATGTCEMETI